MPPAPRLDRELIGSFVRSLRVPETTPADPPGLEFRSDLANAVSRRRHEQARQRDNALAKAGRDGLDPGTFNGIESSGGHIKTDQGCFDRRADVAARVGDGTGGERFWMVDCREGRGAALALFEDR